MSLPLAPWCAAASELPALPQGRNFEKFTVFQLVSEKDSRWTEAQASHIVAHYLN